MNRFYLMPKNTYFVFRRTHKVFHFFLCSFLFVFISSRFHLFSFLFLFHFTFFCFRFFRCFFTVCVVTTNATDLGERFTIRHFLPYTSSCFLTFGTICFYQGFPEADSSSLKIAGPSIQVRNTDLVYLLV